MNRLLLGNGGFLSRVPTASLGFAFYSHSHCRRFCDGRNLHVQRESIVFNWVNPPGGAENRRKTTR